MLYKIYKQLTDQLLELLNPVKLNKKLVMKRIKKVNYLQDITSANGFIMQ